MAQPGPSTTAGPCAGHACDHCSVCRRGRCCRRDRPDYHLPALGDWQEPITGQLGVLASDGEKVQCHICGRWYRYLANHARLAHDLYADEYKALFGLNVTTGLVGPATQALQAAIARRVFHDHWTGEAGRTLGLEDRARYRKGRPQRLQAKLHPELKERQRQRGRERYERGEWRPPGFPPDASAKGVARFQELLQDPAYRAAYGKRIAEARGGRVTTTCVICGTPFETPRFLLAKGQSKVCHNRECFREVRRRYARDHNPYWNSTAYRESRARLSALPSVAFASLDELDRQLVQRHFALVGDEPLTYAALAEQLGISRSQVQRRIVATVAALLAAT